MGGRYTAEVGSFHGKRGIKVSFDSMVIENSDGNSSYQINSQAVSEMVAQTSGVTAEVNADGPVMNIIPREGSNKFSVIGNSLYTNSNLESSNLNDELRDRGFTNVNETYQMWDHGATISGPIMQDKVWFLAAPRTWGFSRQIANAYWNQTQDVFLTPADAAAKVVRWTPWVDRPLSEDSGRYEWYNSGLVRGTWQASQRNKFNVLFDYQRACNCYGATPASAQEATSDYKFQPNMLTQVTWSSPRTNRLLLEAGSAFSISQWNAYWHPGVSPDIIRVTDQTLGVSYGAQTTYRGWPNHTDRYSNRFSATYVTGTHSFKAGMQNEVLVTNAQYITNGNVNYTFRNGDPISITQYSTPYLRKDRGNDFGVYAQDQWSVGRFTFQMGIRYDWYYGWVPAQSTPGDTYGWPGAPSRNEWLGERSYEKVSGVPSWHDINPRVGAAYDLFGNGRTALKFAIGRYVAKTNVDVPAANNPITTSVITTSRRWSDLNKNYVPDCDLGNFGEQPECGAIDNQFFGQNNPRAVQWSDGVLHGWGARDSNWDLSSEIQHQLLEGLSVTTGYYFNTGGYFRNSATLSKNRDTDNTLVGPADFDPFCVTAPTNPELPGGGGYRSCGMYDISAGQVREAAGPGRAGVGLRRSGVPQPLHQLHDGRAAARRRPIRRRRRHRLVRPRHLLRRGQPAGTALLPRGDAVLGQHAAQVQRQLPMKWGLVLAGTFQNLAGPTYDANYPATSAEVAPTLGRPLAGGTRTVTVPLVEPNTLFEARTSRARSPAQQDLQLQLVSPAGQPGRL